MTELPVWLSARGISWCYARAVVAALKKRFPALTAVVKAYPDVVGELELVQLVHELHNGKMTVRDLDELSRPARTDSLSA